MPSDWLSLTTHRLDNYNEKLAKREFLEQFEGLFNNNNYAPIALNELSTAYDYIRLGHPLSCILEWVLARQNNLDPEQVISFSSSTMPIMAVLRYNSLIGQNTQILYTDELPSQFNSEIIRKVYGYNFELKKVADNHDIQSFNGSTIMISNTKQLGNINVNDQVDFYINMIPDLGSIILINTEESQSYINEIQHVRRRETIAMTPANSMIALKEIVASSKKTKRSDSSFNKSEVIKEIAKITGSKTKALVASSGLSMQYAIVMGLIHDALEEYKGKPIKIVVPPNCYGGTNDQARRVAASIENVEVVDLPVDGDNDMVQSTELVLEQLAKEDAVPFIIAEIPTNPRVEVPDLIKLEEALVKKRLTPNGEVSVAPIFILDQTFCPNTQFLGEKEILASVKTIAYVSGSKFPSGGKCTAGYCTSNKKAENSMDSIAQHLNLCDNEATALQYEILAQQLPSMNQRIQDAYLNTREFVNFIKETMPKAKINFVSDELAKEGFTPSVFSLDLPTKGNNDEEREQYKRVLNHKLINSMIHEIPNESKYCVSYGQLKGCYWTIPATSTQGTTKEGDKDYIARVAVSPNLDLDRHKEVFAAFAASI